MNNKIIGELLAPAGNLESALIAYKHGADAVYAGFSRFNAREMNKNFSFDDMSRLSEYSKRNNKKYYNTFNTLIKEDELPLFFEDVTKAVSLEPDALIIQDIGIASLVKEAFPNQPIHTSTQMGLHNSAGVEFGKDFGFERVILERQVTIEEIRQITNKTDMELEVFIHGALCCSLSGACLFSSWIGGYSGNRGKCKQPCRRRYYPTDNKQENGFFFSPADLAMVDKMDELIELGIASFKIEGRLKRSDYIANTVSAYRKMIDGILEGKKKEVRGEARRILGETPGRVWSTGFYEKSGFDSLIQYNKIGVAGKLCGKVLSNERNGVKVEATSYLKPGDRIRFQSNSGEEQPSITIKHINNFNRSDAYSLKPGESGLIKTDVKADRNSRIFKVGSTINVAGKDPSKLPLFSPSNKVDLKIEIKSDQLSVKSQFGDFKAKKYIYAFIFDESENGTFNPESVIKQFKSTANAKWDCGSVDVSYIGNPFLPSSVLKKMRRGFWSHFINQIEENKIDIDSNVTKEFSVVYKAICEKLDSKLIDFSTQYQTKTIKFEKSAKASKKIIKAIPISRAGKDNSDELILPQFCPEDKLDSLFNQFKKAVDNGFTRFRITSLFQLSLIKKLPKGKKNHLFLTAAFPLPATNSLAFYFLLTQLNRVQLWLELSKDEMIEIVNKIPKNSYEQFVSGTLSLLSTRAKIPYHGNIRDSKGLPFIITKDEIGLNHIYSGKNFEVTPIEGASTYEDLSITPFDTKNSSTFNYNYKFV